MQVPPRGVWGASGRALHTSAEAWLGRPCSADPDAVAGMILRYLAAFGPATVRDVQTWSGLTRLSEVVDKLRPRLATFRDEHGRELFDLPDAPRPDPDTPALARYLYDYENLLLSHHDLSRVITEEEFSRQGFTANGAQPSAVLLDGFVAATWTVTRHRDTATLTVRPFQTLTPDQEEALTAEGAKLLTFLAPDSHHEIPFAPPP